eukprot:GHVS01010286.1.p1 GENE.GHVS01010286.1~~GHVS01010286.1.p1  ORF type:complete len:125 (-),score=9.04 GHVS01010286.1:296-646(-)
MGSAVFLSLVSAPRKRSKQHDVPVSTAATSADQPAQTGQPASAIAVADDGKENMVVALNALSRLLLVKEYELRMSQMGLKGGDAKESTKVGCVDSQYVSRTRQPLRTLNTAVCFPR